MSVSDADESHESFDVFEPSIDSSPDDVLSSLLEPLLYPRLISLPLEVSLELLLLGVALPLPLPLPLPVPVLALTLPLMLPLSLLPPRRRARRRW